MNRLLPIFCAETTRGWCGFALGIALAWFNATVVLADIANVFVGRNGSYTQTGDGNSLTDNGFWFSAFNISTDPFEFVSASMTYPGAGSPATLSFPLGPFSLGFGTSLYATQAAMDADFPTGDYTFDAGAFSTTVTYAGDDYPLSQPYLTGADYSDLQGMDASVAFDFHFNPFITGGLATDSFVFLTIYDDTLSALVYDAGFLPASTTGLTLPGGTLTSGHDYRYELIYSNRDQVPSPGALFDAQLGFDYRTLGSFFTDAAAVPEPGSMLLLATSCLGWMGYTVCRRGRKKPVV